jgi:hypothetical protein
MKEQQDGEGKGQGQGLGLAAPASSASASLKTRALAPAPSSQGQTLGLGNKSSSAAATAAAPGAALTPLQAAQRVAHLQRTRKVTVLTVAGSVAAMGQCLFYFLAAVTGVNTTARTALISATGIQFFNILW